MGYKIDSAVIMAAGTSSRFAPLSYERPKALIEVKGEVLIERQIRQLKEAGVPKIVIVTGYKSEQFEYLKDKFGVILVHNAEYLTRNNNGSIYAAREHIKNTYICSSDNYFSINPFGSEVDESYYAAVYSDGETNEWCLTEDSEGYISSVTVGGRDAWYMLGHVFWSEEFSKRFLSVLEDIYTLPETKGMLWEAIYMQRLDTMKLKLKKYDSGVIFEFDTLDELRCFDESYITDTRSEILKYVSKKLSCKESDLKNVVSVKGNDNAAAGAMFEALGKKYVYTYENRELKEVLL